MTTRPYFIDEISDCHAVISIRRNDDDYYYYLTLKKDYDIVSDYDYFYELSYKSYFAIIQNVQGIDDDGLFELPPHEIAYVNDFIKYGDLHYEYSQLFD